MFLDLVKDLFPDASPGIVFEHLLSRSVFILFITTITISIRFIIISGMKSRSVSVSTILQWKRASGYTIALFTIFLFMFLLLPSLGGLLGGVFAIFSIIGTGILLVLKEPFQNVIGWVYIVTRRPFEIGHRISVANFIGDVIDIRILEFSMIEVRSREDGGQSTGRILRVPNSMLFTTPMANSSKEFSFHWNEIHIPLTVDSDWEKAIQIVENVAEEIADQILEHDTRLTDSAIRYAIRYQNIHPRVYVEFKNSAIHVILRYLSEPTRMRDMTDSIWKELLRRFKKERKISLHIE